MKKHEGFTIIEVALVLGIAGLIFAAVFIALPSLLAAERDTTRRDNVLTFVQQLKNFTSNNNRGALPTFNTSNNNQKYNERGAVLIDGETITPASKMNGTTWEEFYAGYFDENFSDPDGPRYNLYIMQCNDATHKNNAVDTPCERQELTDLKNSTFPNNHQFYVVTGATCDGESVKLSANSRKVAVLYKLEASGTYCQEM